MTAGALTLRPPGCGNRLAGDASRNGAKDRVVAQDRGMNSPVSSADATDIRATLAGDEDAFARLLKRHQAAVYSQMWHFSRDRDTVDELVQEVFIEVFVSLGKFKGRAPFLHWVRRIATRVGYRHWKRRKREQQVNETVQALSRNEYLEPTPHNPSAAGQYLFELLEGLRPKDRLVLTLHYFEGCATKEIADRLGLSPLHVRVRMHRARRKLRDLLVSAGFGRISNA